MNEQTFWETQAPKSDTQLVEVKRQLPAELLTRFDEFLTRAHEISAEAEKELKIAKEFAVVTEASFQMADSLQANLKNMAKTLNDERMSITRPIDDFKQQFVDAAKPALDSYTQAAKVYTDRMSAFRRDQRAKAEAAQREAERLLREEREKKEAEARKLEEKAAKLKTPAAQQKAMQQADEIRTVAAMMPESVALAAAEPQTVASNVAEIHEVEKIENMSEYLRWLADHPEWHTVLDFKAAEHKRLAKQFHSIGVPGVKFGQRDSFRTKARR